MGYDLHFQIIEPELQPTLGNFSFKLNNSLRVKGKYKMANLWLKTFLTPKNSHPIKRTQGTEFFFILGSNFSSFADLQMQIMEYVDDASNQVKTVQNKTPLIPDDERFERAELIKFNIINQFSIEVWVKLYNRAGTFLNVLIPYTSA